ncbi:NmrA family NAD(P)-binding protein [Nocardia sp. NPDC059764]|uniref:NmrA family NAD(P)-binding protein n=1 Tax=Nocardia sp. NPDC059764 TaxID=3346939 RepID=UPI00366291D4
MMLTMMKGVHITTEGIAAEQRRGRLAEELGIEHFVYSSLRGAGQDTGVEYYAARTAIEGYIHELELPATILRPTFLDNLNGFTRPMLDESGMLQSSISRCAGTFRSR